MNEFGLEQYSEPEITQKQTCCKAWFPRMTAQFH
jgi:hypothetical protein